MTPIHLLLATDGSGPSLEAARMVRDLRNAVALSRVTILAVVAPITATPVKRMHRTVDSFPKLLGTTWPNGSSIFPDPYRERTPPRVPRRSGRSLPCSAQPFPTCTLLLTMLSPPETRS